MIKHLNIKVFGRVQGIGFRYSTFKKAQELDLKGFVRNEGDGSVYIEAEGERQSLEKFINWCRQSPGLANVFNVEVTEGEFKNFTDFLIF